MPSVSSVVETRDTGRLRVSPVWSITKAFSHSSHVNARAVGVTEDAITSNCQLHAIPQEGIHQSIAPCYALPAVDARLLSCPAHTFHPVYLSSKPKKCRESTRTKDMVVRNDLYRHLVYLIDTVNLSPYRTQKSSRSKFVDGLCQKRTPRHNTCLVVQGGF